MLNAMTNAIVVDDLTRTFGSFKALDGVSFEVPAGTVFGLLGPNGAGKTTTVRVLTTILAPDSGRAEVLGYDVVHQARQVRPLIGLAGQYAAVDQNLTGTENLQLIGRLTHLPTREIAPRAKELLERFGLSHAADRPVRGYSGGMRRRLDLAAALVHRPPVLFLDEPTTGLDLQGRAELWEMIQQLVGDGTTVLLTTQYLEEADRLAARIAVVDEGKVIANDTPAALKSRLGNTVIELRFARLETAESAQTRLAAVSGLVEREGSVLRINANNAAHELMDVLRTLDAADLAPASLSVREPSLDDVFLTLTGHRTESTKPADEPDELSTVGA